jgi:enoyl-[acyl-carrier protein] reductase II
MAREYIRREKEGADRLELEKYTHGSLRRAVLYGDVENGSLMAGQVAGMCNHVRPVAEIIRSLFSKSGDVLEKLDKEFSWPVER